MFARLERRMVSGETSTGVIEYQVLTCDNDP